MIKTGIFGGSFNPIHNGHIALARQILQKSDLEEIWFVVSPQNPLKTSDSLEDDEISDHDGKQRQQIFIAPDVFPFLFPVGFPGGMHDDPSFLFLTPS